MLGIYCIQGTASFEELLEAIFGGAVLVIVFPV